MEDKSTLTVLETLSNDSNIHQRKIAATTGLNLAKVNFVLKKLVDKGFVKLKRAKNNPNKRRYLYLLTPAGVAEKSRLTYRYMKKMLRQYEGAEGKVRDCIESMIAQGVHRVALWGQTEISDLCEKVFKGMDGQIKIVGVVDPTGRNPSSLRPSMLASLGVDAVLICDTESPEPPPGIPAWRLP